MHPTSWRAITRVRNCVEFIKAWTSMELLSDYDYALPEHLIAQTPLENRRDSKLLVLRRSDAAASHHQFDYVLDCLNPGDGLVINTSKVMKARLRGFREVTGGKVEILLSRMLSHNTWIALVRATGKKLNMRVSLGCGSATIVGPAPDEDGAFIVEIHGDLNAIMESCGDLPLPLYIARSPTQEDETRYQTVYAQGDQRSVAAPTAGLHFDLALLNAIRNKGVKVIPVTLHVGAGTFLPVRYEEVAKHQMHAEWAAVSEDSAQQINAIKKAGGRIITVGTTATRTLESASTDNGEVVPGSILTRLFIRPGYRFRVVDALITNFHLPKTTLFMLVCAAVGLERTKRAYYNAVENSYRFFSYGDACYFELTDEQ